MLTTTQSYTLHKIRKIKKETFKRYIAIFALMLVTLTFITAMMPKANAWVTKDDPSVVDEWERYRAKSYAALGTFGGICWDVVSTTAGCNPHFNLTSIAGSIYKVASYSGKFEYGNLTGDSSLIGAGQNMYNYMKVVGMCLIFLYFLIDLLDEVQADSFTIERLIKHLLTLTIAIVVLNIGGEIFNYICQLGDALIEDSKVSALNGEMGEMDDIYNSLIGTAPDKGGAIFGLKLFIKAIGLLAEHVIPFLITFVAYLIAYLISFSRFIEILVRFAFAPIGMAQLVSGGAKGPGMRYIKKFASCVLQGAVCVLAFGTVSIIQSATTLVGAFFTSVLVPITLIGFLLKTSRIADDICGV